MFSNQNCDYRRRLTATANTAMSAHEHKTEATPLLTNAVFCCGVIVLSEILLGLVCDGADDAGALELDPPGVNGAVEPGGGANGALGSEGAF